MTDEDLIARLNNLFWMLEEEGHYTKANTARFASDHIEAQAAEIERLRGDLKRAVEALGEIATDEHPLGWIAITALAELTGDKT